MHISRIALATGYHAICFVFATPGANEIVQLKTQPIGTLSREWKGKSCSYSAAEWRYSYSYSTRCCLEYEYRF
ncbi:MAG: hypothetical protein AAGD07_06500, partial [Planctomycetota bacterium]